VLAAVRSAPDDQISDKNVFLSTGLSNDPQDRASAEATIALLKTRGARNVTVSGLGTGNVNTGELGPDNVWLAETAKKYGARFGGAIPTNQLTDGIHPKSYKVFRRKLEAGLPKATARCE